MAGRNEDTRAMPGPDGTLSFEDRRAGEMRRDLQTPQERLAYDAVQRLGMREAEATRLRMTYVPSTKVEATK